MEGKKNTFKNMVDYIRDNYWNIKEMAMDDYGSTSRDKTVSMLMEKCDMSVNEAEAVIGEFEQGFSAYDHLLEVPKGNSFNIADILSNMTENMDEEKKHDIYTSALTLSRFMTGSNTEEINLDYQYDQYKHLSYEEIEEALEDVLNKWQPSTDQVADLKYFLLKVKDVSIYETYSNNILLVIAAYVYIAQREGSFSTADIRLSPTLLAMAVAAGADVSKKLIEKYSCFCGFVEHDFAEIKLTKEQLSSKNLIIFLYWSSIMILAGLPSIFLIAGYHWLLYLGILLICISLAVFLFMRLLAFEDKFDDNALTKNIESLLERAKTILTKKQSDKECNTETIKRSNENKLHYEVTSCNISQDDIEKA